MEFARGRVSAIPLKPGAGLPIPSENSATQGGLVSALSGTLDQFMPVQILRLLQNARSTGRLEIIRGAERADLFLVEGRSAFALTNAVHLRVGDVLINGGDIRPEAVALIAGIQEDQPGSPLGRMLVESGAVDEPRMRAAVLEVQRRIVCNVLLWQTGEFRFLPGERANDEDMMLDLDLDRLFLESLRLAANGEARGDEIAA
jgi:hypothetical protein